MQSSTTLLNLNITIQNSWLNCWIKIDVVILICISLLYSEGEKF